MLESRRLGRWGRIPRGANISSAHSESRASRTRCPAVLCLVRDDREDPRPEGRARAEAPERPVSLDEGFLCCILGLSLISRDEERDAQGKLLVALDELFVRTNIALPRKID